MKKKIDAEIQVLAKGLLQEKHLHTTHDWKEKIKQLYDKMCVLEYLEAQLELSQEIHAPNPQASNKPNTSLKEEANYKNPLAVVLEESSSSDAIGKTEAKLSQSLASSFKEVEKEYKAENHSYEEAGEEKAKTEETGRTREIKEVEKEYKAEKAENHSYAEAGEEKAKTEETGETRETKEVEKTYKSEKAENHSYAEAKEIKTEAEDIEQHKKVEILERDNELYEIEVKLETEDVSKQEETILFIQSEELEIVKETSAEENLEREALEFTRIEEEKKSPSLQPPKRESEALNNFASNYQTPVFDRKTPDKDSNISQNTAKKTKSLNDSVNRGLHIGLNDRIAFINNLFSGSTQDFNRVLSQINTMADFSSVESFLENQIKPDYNHWEGKEEYSERFAAIIEKKFS